MKRLLPVALMLSLAAATATGAQPGALTYPSVAREAPRAAVPTTRAPAVTVVGERLRAAAPRVSTEPAHGVFVYERLGATPRLLAPMPAHAVADLQPTVAQR